MWGRTRASRPDESNATRDRLASILGLAIEEGASTASHPNATDAPDHPAQRIQPVVTAPDGFSTAIGTLAQRLTHENDESLTREPAAIGRQAAGDTVAEAAQVRVVALNQPDPGTVPAAKAADISGEGQRVFAEHTKVFQDQLGELLNRTLCQSEAAVHSSISRLEACFAQAKYIESTMDEKLANLTRSALQAAQEQAKVLEGAMSTIAGQVESQMTAALEPAVNWIQNYRVQADEINSALEASLKGFSQKATEAALLQTRSFQESLAAISGQVVSQTEHSLQSKIAELREMAARSLEDEMAALSQRVQQSQSQSLQARLDEIVESSRVKLERFQLQSGRFSTELLMRVRADSEVIATELNDRFESDAEVLETKMVATIRGRLQKLTNEFGSIFDALQQDSRESEEQ